MSDTALLLLDVQAGNFSGHNPIYNGDELLTRVKSLINKARTACMPIVYVQNSGGSGDPDEFGTAGWDIHASLKPVKGDIVIQKQTPDAFHNTMLCCELASRRIRSWLLRVYKRSIVSIPPVVARSA